LSVVERAGADEAEPAWRRHARFAAVLMSVPAGLGLVAWVIALNRVGEALAVVAVSTIPLAVSIMLARELWLEARHSAWTFENDGVRIAGANVIIKWEEIATATTHALHSWIVTLQLRSGAVVILSLRRYRSPPMVWERMRASLSRHGARVNGGER
jgi:hypothetical protein